MFHKEAVEKIKLRILYKICFENRVVYDIMWKNMVQPDKTKMTI